MQIFKLQATSERRQLRRICLYKTSMFLQSIARPHKRNRSEFWGREGVGNTATATRCHFWIESHFCRYVLIFYRSLSSIVFHKSRSTQITIMKDAAILLLWTQFCYALWQFVRVAKILRIPYGILNSLLACVYFFIKNKSRIILPFQKVVYTPVGEPSSGVTYFVSSQLFEFYGVDANATSQRGDLENATSSQNGEHESAVANGVQVEDAASSHNLEATTSSRASSPSGVLVSAASSRSGDLESAAPSQIGEIESATSSSSRELVSAASSLSEELESDTFQFFDVEKASFQSSDLPNARFGFSELQNRLPLIWTYKKSQQYYEERLLSRKCKLRLNGEDYNFLLKGKETFLLTICRDEPVLFCTVSDMILPGWSIVEPMNQADALNKIICEGYHALPARCERVLPIWYVEDELNRNFIRILSTFPLVAQAKGRHHLSHFLFCAVIAVDQLGLLFETIHQKARDLIFHAFRKVVSERISSPKTRIAVCQFFSTFDKGLNFCDNYCHNFVRIKKGQEYLVCNPRACQLGGELGDYIRDHEPVGNEVTSSTFTDVYLETDSGSPHEFQSSRYRLYEIGEWQLYIDESDGGDRATVYVFCSHICVHSGYIGRETMFYMLNTLNLVAEKGHLPVNRARGNRAHSVPLNDFIRDPLYFLSVQIFRATKNMWICE